MDLRHTIRSNTVKRDFYQRNLQKTVNDPKFAQR